MELSRNLKKLNKYNKKAEIHLEYYNSYIFEIKRILREIIKEHPNITVILTNGEVRNIRNLQWKDDSEFKDNKKFYDFYGIENGKEVGIDCYQLSIWIENDEVIWN